MSKTIKKLFVACAAVTAITAVTAMSASADGITATASSDGSKVTVKLAGDKSVSGETTIVLLKGDYTQGAVSSVDEANIIYINQDAAETAKAENGFLATDGVLPSETLVGGQTYTAKVADETGSFIYQTTFTLGGDDSDDIEYGNVNGDHKADGSPIINSADSSMILKHVAEIITLDDNQIAAANVYQDYKPNGDAIVNSADASTILKYVAELVTELPVVPGN